jgi:soluble lytic murein transglycosylase-like protein
VKFSKTILASAAIFCLSLPASAGPWYAPAHEGKPYINAKLTPQKAVTGEFPERWNHQLVLWEGVLGEQKTVGNVTTFTLQPEGKGAPIAVICPQRVATLQVDRGGYRVAVKGELESAAGKFDHLTGRSVILIYPPRPWVRSKSLNEALTTQVKAGHIKADDRLVPFLAWWVNFHRPDYDAFRCLEIALALEKNSRIRSLDPLLLASLIQVESAFKVDAVSCTGAVGLGQLMPGTAQGLGVDPWKITENLAGCAHMLANLLQNWATHVDPRPFALASYNAGPNLVRSLGQIPAIPQTTNYVYFIGYVHDRMSQVARSFGVVEPLPNLE